MPPEVSSRCSRVLAFARLLCRLRLTMDQPVFDANYYKRYYERPTTAVITPREATAEVAFVLAFCRHIKLDIKRFTDVGAGTGWWAKEFRQQCPRCRQVETFEASETAASAYGHTLMRAEKTSGRPSDLVVCRDVLRYLDNRAAEKAIKRLASKCRGVLYLHVLTRDDEVDEKLSDMGGKLRSATWYRRRLADAGFANAGMGLFVSRKFKQFDPFAIETL